jgi:aminopeptidase N
MQNPTPRAIARSDYKPFAFSIVSLHLQFDLNPTSTLVQSKMLVHRNVGSSDTNLVLDGCDLELVEVKIDGRVLNGDAYALEPAIKPTTLTIHNVPSQSVIEITTRIDPQSNTVLEGLYLSSGIYCTQCEAEGFRRITWYPDRPDVMTRFTTKIIAAKEDCPVLLSNGNLVSSGELEDGRHWAQWEDPWPKPSYLFALVAGNLSFIRDDFQTASGRRVELFIYVQQHNVDKCDHAMASLVRAMKWDEEVYGLEYDLDQYMIVAVDDFNMGAMENKGLNVFNSKYVLADQSTATDKDFLGIESVIAHEYFHNWTGNRVTCRDWFQLSLKEGLTVFRDQEFSADQHSRAVKRIEDVRVLRSHQFPEDAGPLAHPVRPESYIEINNFYTLTIYEKGAELIRMMHTLIGADRFRAALDLYFQRHDGQAVTCEDFVLCMEAAAKVDLSRFRLWYSQSGTPRLNIQDSYDANNSTYKLIVSQSIPPTDSQPIAQAMHIPLVVSLFDEEGRSIPLQTGSGADKAEQYELVLDVTRSTQEYQFENVKQRPVPSLLRGFSAPVILKFGYSDTDLAFLLAHETDPFNRWEAGQRLATSVIDRFHKYSSGGQEVPGARFLVDAFRKTLTDENIDRAFLAELLLLPDIETIADGHEVFDVDRLDRSRNAIQKMLAAELHDELATLVQQSHNADFSIDAEAMSSRALANICLRYLASLNDDHWLGVVRERFSYSNNMTDQSAALSVLLEFDQLKSADYVEAFYRRWRDQRLVIDKWFSIQASANVHDATQRVERLLEHADFDHGNPNRVRSVLGAFSGGNPVAFHQSDGKGYQLLCEQIILLDNLNPQVAARLAVPLTRWRRMDETRRQLMKSSLIKIAQKPNLSRDVFEMVNRALDG